MTGDNPVTFRLASVDDLPELADLRWRLQTDDAANFDIEDRARFIAECGAALKVDLQNGPFSHWIAEADGKVVTVMSVGKVAKVPSPRGMQRHWGYLTNCYTLPLYRNRGIATELLATIKKWAKEQRYEFLVVWPSDRSYPFYERAGFERPADPLVLNLEDEQ